MNLYKQYTDIWHCRNKSRQTEVMQFRIIKRLDKLGMKYTHEKNGNIFVGNFKESAPCIVAHMDSVHSQRPKRVTLNDAGILTSKNGIGADDKAGIVATLELLRLYNGVNAIFTVDEEVGGLGASAVKKEMLKNVQFFIQTDRRGSDDVITSIGTPTASAEFIKKIKPLMKKFGFKEADGMYTDIDTLTETVDITGINISSGYYKPHTEDEYVNLFELQNTIKFMDNVIDKCAGTQYKIKNRQEQRPIFYSGYGDIYGAGRNAGTIAIDKLIKRFKGREQEITDAIEEAYSIGYDDGIDDAEYNSYAYTQQDDDDALTRRTPKIISHAQQDAHLRR